MKLELSVYSAICETETFKINGIQATYQDFGDKFDTSPDQSKPHFCGNMRFSPKMPTQQVFDKYQINATEYAYICEQLKKCVSFGTCRLCG